MYFRYARRLLTETDKRLLWKLCWNFAFKGARAIAKHKRRLARDEFFPPFLYISIINSCNLRCQGCWIDVAAKQQTIDLPAMNRLIDDLLSLSSVEVNERVRPSGQISLLTIVDRAIAALETQSKAAKKPIRLEVAEPGCIVLGDEDELTQVFHNLIDNALKYSRENTEVTVSVETRDDVTGLAGPAAAVSVTDQGEGIQAEHIPRLTERFYRVDTSRSREKGGTGLGLAIVKHILNRHRGRLLIDSKKGVGSTFTVCLPLEAKSQTA